MAIYRNENVNSLPEQVQENKENIKNLEEAVERIDPEAITAVIDQVATNTQDIANIKAEQVVQNTAIGGNATAINNEKTTREGVVGVNLSGNTYLKTATANKQILIENDGHILKFDNTGAITIDDENVPIKMEDIKDANENLRFIEGNIALYDQAVTDGLELRYGKWSLSGTHLMIVACVYIPKDVGYTGTYLINPFTLPPFIRSKITAIIGGGLDVVSYKTENIVVENSYVLGNDNVTLLLREWASELIITTTEITADNTNNRALRVQFDLLIDAE